MVWKQMVLKSLFFNSGQTTPTPVIRSHLVFGRKVQACECPVALSFVCGAPFSEAAGEASEGQLGVPEVFGWARLSPLSPFSCWLRERTWRNTHADSGSILRPLVNTTAFSELWLGLLFERLRF